MTNSLTGLTRLVKAGRTFDYECSRTTHRIQRTRAILGAMGATPTVDHNPDAVVFDWATSKERHECDANGHKCVTTWPEWVTDDLFNIAASAAEVAIVERAEWMRKPIRV